MNDYPPGRFHQPDDSLLDDSGLGRAEKRAALMEMQGGACAVCGAVVVLIVDHDHETGLIRGLLCRSCNIREGQMASGLLDVVYEDIAAYLAAPPAAGLGWRWDIPEPVTISAGDAVAALVVASLPAIPGDPDYRGATTVKPAVIKTIGELREQLAAHPADAQVSVEAPDGQFRFITVVTDVGEGRSVILRTARRPS